MAGQYLTTLARVLLFAVCLYSSNSPAANWQQRLGTATISELGYFSGSSNNTNTPYSMASTSFFSPTAANKDPYQFGTGDLPF